MTNCVKALNTFCKTLLKLIHIIFIFSLISKFSIKFFLQVLFHQFYIYEFINKFIKINFYSGHIFLKTYAIDNKAYCIGKNSFYSVK